MLSLSALLSPTTALSLGYIGHNMHTRYHLRDGHKDNELQVIEEERDLGICSSANLKSGLPCRRATAKATAILGMIRRNLKKTQHSELYEVKKLNLDDLYSMVIITQLL